MKNSISIQDPLRRLGRAVFCFFLLCIASWNPAAQASQSPQEALDTFLQTIRAMEFPVQDPVRHTELVKKADAFLDMEAMGKAALRDHWDQASDEERRAFIELLWKLIENIAYPNSRRFLGDLRITYPEIREDTAGVLVKSLVKKQEQALDAEVIYHLYPKNGQWKIDDVILDEISLIEDLKYQFDKIIAESKFSGLLETMQKRLADARIKNQTAAS